MWTSEQINAVLEPITLVLAIAVVLFCIIRVIVLATRPKRICKFCESHASIFPYTLNFNDKNTLVIDMKEFDVEKSLKTVVPEDIIDTFLSIPRKMYVVTIDDKIALMFCYRYWVMSPIAVAHGRDSDEVYSILVALKKRVKKEENKKLSERVEKEVKENSFLRK